MTLMLGFGRKKTPKVTEAERASIEAETELEEVRAKHDDVDEILQRLKFQLRENHFGEDFEIAMMKGRRAH